MEGRDPTPPPSSDVTKETYIVQIPRDQIYRVPPPANARIVESYRTSNSKKDGCGGKCCLWIVITLLAIAAAVGIGVEIIHILFSPKAPEFSITGVLVKNTSTSHNKHPLPIYEISLEVYNQNNRMGVSYEDGGKTLLSFEQKNIGIGNYPSSFQERKDSTTVHVTLADSNGTLPRKVEKSMKETKSKTPVSMSLTMDIPVKMKSFIPRSQELTVTCDFQVSTLGSVGKILSENCDSKF